MSIGDNPMLILYSIILGGGLVGGLVGWYIMHRLGKWANERNKHTRCSVDTSRAQANKAIRNNSSKEINSRVLPVKNNNKSPVTSNSYCEMAVDLKRKGGLNNYNNTFDKGLDCIDAEEYAQAAVFFSECIEAKYNLPASLFFHSLANVNCATTGKLMPKFMRRNIVAGAIKTLEKAQNMNYDYWQTVYVLGWAHFVLDYMYNVGSSGGFSSTFLQYSDALEENHTELYEKLYERIVEFKINFEG